MKVLRKIGLDDATSADLAQLPQRYIYEPLDGKVRKELPRNALVRLVGGEGFEYYVANDAVQREAKGGVFGQNFAEGSSEKRWFDNAKWRIEIESPAGAPKNRFLVAMSPSLGLDRSREVNSLSLIDGNADALVTPDSVIVFTAGKRLDDLSFILPGEQRRVLLVDVFPDDKYQIRLDDESVSEVAGRSGVLEIILPANARRGSVVKLVQE
jgi:hypothetical protein